VEQKNTLLMPDEARQFSGQLLPGTAHGSSWSCGSVWSAGPARRGTSFGMVVAQGVDRDAAQRIQVRASVGVPRLGSPGRATARSAGGRRCS
jgi:hypothetical protein